jgi:hypothetical protein
MRIATLKLVLSIIAVSTAMMLGARPAAATICFIFQPDLYLVTPLTLSTSPGAGPVLFQDSPALSRSGGNTWQLIGEWENDFNVPAGCFFLVDDINLWLGLKNSDDQGTNFNLRVDVYSNNGGVGVAHSKTFYCIKGLTRNPDKALNLTYLPTFAEIAGYGPQTQISVSVFAQIGTPQNPST